MVYRRWPTHNASYLVLLVALVAILILCAVSLVANGASIEAIDNWWGYM
jgi:hypothetical protein